MKGILDAATDVKDRAFISAMRWSGLRISDVTRLRRDALDEKGELFLYAQKNGQLVRVPLPDNVAKDLRAVENSNPDYFFWSGIGKWQTAAHNWRKRIARAFKRAGIHGESTHRFRHTLVFDLLMHGVSLGDIADLIEDSPETVAKYYSGWAPERQDRLSDIIRTVYKTSITA